MSLRENQQKQEERSRTSTRAWRLSPEFPLIDHLLSHSLLGAHFQLNQLDLRHLEPAVLCSETINENECKYKVIGNGISLKEEY